jgi:hypothetical protein
MCACPTEGHNIGIQLGAQAERKSGHPLRARLSLQCMRWSRVVYRSKSKVALGRSVSDQVPSQAESHQGVHRVSSIRPTLPL